MIFSIAIGADYSFDIKSGFSIAPAFSLHNNFDIASVTREGWVMCIFYSSLFPNKRMLIQISNSLFEALLKARSDYLRNRLKLSSFVLGLDNVKKQKKSEYASGSLIFFSSKSKIN